MTNSPLADTQEFVVPEDAQSRFFGPTPPPVQIDIGALTDKGKVRENNEDHFAVVRRRRSRTALMTNLPEGDLPDVDEDAYALVVADGMGGAAFGEVASRLALRAAGELGLSELKWPLKMNEKEAHEVFEKFETYAQLLNEQLLCLARDDPKLRGMGTTVTAAYTVGPEAFIAHVGDSRVYLFRDGRVEQLTKDHTLAEQMKDSLIIADATQMRYMNRVLTNCIGVDDAIHIDVMHLTLRDQDRLLLCTDGLSDMVADEEITLVMRSHADSQKTCQALVDRALEHGGRDNITVITARYEIDEQT